MVAPADNTKRITALSRVFDDLVEAHGTLLGVIEDKIAAMRAADTGCINVQVAREKELVERIIDREGLRRRLFEDIGRGYGIGPQAARRLRVSQLADRIGSPHNSKINAAADRLRALTTQIAQRNHMAQTISETVLGHVKRVIGDMTSARAFSSGYSSDGAPVGAEPHRVLDAVG